jgi:hypothetical protein
VFPQGKSHISEFEFEEEVVISLSLPLTFKPSDRTHDGNTLIHDNFANVEVGSDPRLCGFVVCDFVFVYTGAGLWLVLCSSRFHGVWVGCCEDGGRGGRQRWKGGRGVAHVRPVDRFTPARKAEMRTASKA